MFACLHASLYVSKHAFSPPVASVQVKNRSAPGIRQLVLPQARRPTWIPLAFGMGKTSEFLFFAKSPLTSAPKSLGIGTAAEIHHCRCPRPVLSGAVT